MTLGYFYGSVTSPTTSFPFFWVPLSTLLIVVRTRERTFLQMLYTITFTDREAMMMVMQAKTWQEPISDPTSCM